MPTIRVALSSIKPNPNNPRIIKDDKFRKLVASIRSFPEMLELRPIVVNADNVVLGGNMRLRACQEAGMKEVPVLRADTLTPDQQREFIIKDNVGFGEWNWDALANTWDAEELDAWGLDVPFVEKTEEGLTDPEEVPDTPENPITNPGDLWILGQHRLLCGDSTADDAKLFGRNCPTLFFDPPWDAGISIPARDHTLAFCDGQRMHDIVTRFGAPTWAFAWDCVSSWYTPSRPLKRMKLCLWYGQIGDYDFNGSHYGDAGERRQVSNTRGSYDFEPDARGKHLSDVFSAPITQLHSDSEHSHGKPLDWVRMIVANCTKGDIYDPFLGSGTTLMAAEQLGRTCYGMEINPAYCDVIVKRWEDFTGEKAVRETGKEQG